MLQRSRTFILMWLLFKFVSSIIGATSLLQNCFDYKFDYKLFRLPGKIKNPVFSYYSEL